MRQRGHILEAFSPPPRRKQQIHEVPMPNGGSSVNSNGCASCWSDGVARLRRQPSAWTWWTQLMARRKTRQQARPICDSRASRRTDFSSRLSSTQPSHLVKKTGPLDSWMSSRSLTACVRSFGSGGRRVFDSYYVADILRRCDFNLLC